MAKGTFDQRTPTRAIRGMVVGILGFGGLERRAPGYGRELGPVGVGQDSPGLFAGPPDVDSTRPEREEAVDLLIAVRGAAGEVQMHAVLNRLGVGDRHEADAEGCVLVDPDDDLVLALGENLPAKRLGPEPGQAGQIANKSRWKAR